MRTKLWSVLIALSLIAAWCIPAYSDDVYPTPHTFYGSVTINGLPAPAGISIEARGTNVITGVPDNPITTTEPGRYGNAQPGEHRLPVTGYNMVEGTLLRFYIGEVAADQTAKWHSGYNTCLNLSFTITGELEIRKVDSSGIALGGATFMITPNPQTWSGNLTVADNGANDEDPAVGVLLVSGVKLNQEYTVHETMAPAGYQAAADQKVTLTSAEKATLTFVNKPGQLEIRKVDSSGNALGGATFMITPNPQTWSGNLTVADNGANDEDPAIGALLVSGVKLKQEYTVHEAMAPAGYQAAADQKVTLTSTEKVTLTFVNKPGQLEIRKVDSSGNALGGAIFMITPNPQTWSGNLTVADNGANDEDPAIGALLVSGVKLKQEYTVHEAMAPAGYQAAADQKVTLTSTEKVTLTFVNKPGQLEIRKVDGSGNALGGAIFMITPNPQTWSGNLTVADNGANDEDPAIGALLVSGVKLKQEYTVHEAMAPAGYQAAADQKVTLTSTEKVTLTFVNKPGQLEIRKVDSSGNALGGATFMITPNPQNWSGNLTVADNGANDEDPAAGVLLVSGVKLNQEYMVHEAMAPAGYQAAADQKVTLTSAEKATLTFINTSTGGGGGGGGGGGSGGSWFVPSTPTPTPGVTDLTGKVDAGGQFLSEVKVVSADQKAWVVIKNGTVGHTASGAPLTTISVIRVTENIPAGPANFFLGSQVYDFSPGGAVFDRPVYITIQYDPALLPAGTEESRLTIYWYDAANSRWVELTGTVDTVNKTVTVEITHFTFFAVFISKPAVPTVTGTQPAEQPKTTTPIASQPVSTSPVKPTITTSATPQPTGLTPSFTPGKTVTATPGSAIPTEKTAEIKVNWGLLIGIIAGVVIIAGIIMAIIITKRRKLE